MLCDGNGSSSIERVGLVQGVHFFCGAMQSKNFSSVVIPALNQTVIFFLSFEDPFNGNFSIKINEVLLVL